MFSYIRDNVRPPGLRLKRLASIYRVIGRVFGLVRDDVERIQRAFFPFLATPQELRAHARALDIPEFDADSPGGFRGRVTEGGSYLEERGYRGRIAAVIARRFPQRYKIVEFPADGFRVGHSAVGRAPVGSGGTVHLFIRGMSTQDEREAYAFLDYELDPDIAIRIKEWVSFPV